jgi:hypothetical protein
MNGRATKFLSLLILFAALSGLAAQEGNPGQRRLDLPYRQSPHALGGQDRPDLRRNWNLFWFGGKISPAYLDYKNRVAAAEVRRWGHLFPQGPAVKLPPSTGPANPSSPQPTAQPTVQPAASSSGPTWVNRGPTANLTTSSFPDIDSGRPVAIVSHPTLTTLYLATSGGGVFRCDNADPASTTDWTWVPITDGLPSSGSSGNVAVGALAMSPANPNVLYLGAGDMQDATGRGFYTSTDGGTTWTAATGLGNATRSYAILPVDANVVLWGTDDGLKISTNGGASFTAVSGGLPMTRARSIQKFGASDFICTMQDSTDPYVGTIYFSTSGGTSWAAATITGLSFTAAKIGRITVAAAGDGVTAYAILENMTNASSSVVAPGVLKTVDKGHTWVWVTPTTAPFTTYVGNPNSTNDKGDGGQGWYNQMITVDPSNPLRAFIGSNLAAWRTTDGGVNWIQLTHWYGYGHVYAHADFHAATWSSNGSTLYLANDGGLSIVRDPFRSPVPTGTSYVASVVTFIDNRRNRGLVSHMVYNVGSTASGSPADSKWRITLGMQDNGTRVRQPNTSAGALTGTEGTFEDRIGGDGFGTLIHPANGDLMLGSVYYTDIYRSTDGGASNFSESISGITEANDKNFAPFAPKLVSGDIAHPDTVYTSTNGKVYKSANFGTSWIPLGTTNLPPPLDNSSIIPSTDLFIRNLSAAAGDQNALGLAANQSRVYLSYAGGNTWTQAAALPGSASYLSCIEFDRANSATVYVGSVAPVATANHLWKSTNSGASWTAIDVANGFPSGIPVHVVKADPLIAQKVYAGTDFGVYVSSNGGSTWSRFGSNLPMVAVRDLYVAPDGSFLRAATYGRGVWELQAPQLSVSLDKTTTTVNPTTTTTFTATVTNYATDNKVNWTVSTGGGAVSPTQTASGSATTYTAPATPGVYTVTATSNESPTATASATVNVYNPASVAVSVVPTTKTLVTGGSFTFTASVTNAPSTAVSWSASGGSITPGGVYTAPATAGTYTITATSVWSASATGTATVTVKSLDLNGDNTVDLRDLLFFAKYYGTTNAGCDLNGDGTVDDADLAILLAGL